MPSRLMHLRVDKFRHVRPGTTINFGARFNTVVGQNGAGKTTLLELVSAILRNDFRAFAEEDWTVHAVLEDSSVVLEATLENRITATSPLRSAITIKGELRYDGREIQIDGNDQQTTFTTADGALESHEILSSSNFRGFDLISETIDALHETAWSSLTPPLSPLPLFDDCTRITEGIETFIKLFGPGDTTPSIMAVVAVEPTNDDPQSTYGVNIDSSSLNTTSSKSDQITITAWPTFDQLIELSQYTSARLILTKTARQLRAGQTFTTFANPLARFTTRSGNEIPHHQLSFGEKRLLTFLIKLYAYPHTIIVDELANGMHHAWIERCIELIEELGTQAFLSSQNPLLLDCLPLTRETYGTDHALVICEFSDSGEMVWRNLSEAETTDFFKSLDVGIQHVSEIMRSKGLW